MDDDDDKKPQGCGLFGIYSSMFHRQPASACRSASTNSLHQASPRAVVSDAKLIHSDSKRRHSTDDALTTANIRPSEMSAAPTPTPPPIPTPAPTPMNTRNYPKGNAGGRPQDTTRTMQGQRQHAARGGSSGISTELDNMIHDHQRTKGSSMFVRASSGNVMIYGNLGNLRAPGAVTPNRNVLDYLPETANERNATGTTTGKQQGDGMKMRGGNTFEEHGSDEEPQVPASMCRALSRRFNSEELKEMGNEEYKKGNFAEAVDLYDRAILIDSQKAPYWSNKAAALIGLGKLLDAVTECREAVRIDPSYHRAHHRLATLYHRLGEAERALHHYKLSQNEASAADISRTQGLQVHLSKCSEARRVKDWHTELKESQAAISSGADSAPKVFAFKAEALIMLSRHEEAETDLSARPKFDIDACTKFFGTNTNAFVLMVQAQVDMAAGRFEDALSMANRAARLDTSSREAAAVARKARTMASARATGNDLFKASKFKEACAAYGEGLDHDSNNAILLCNRAACRSKLGQWEKAIEDCNAALNLRPSYSKARLRRADCNAKLERWESSIQDYEALVRDMPGDEEVQKALCQVQVQLQKQQGEYASSTKNASDLVHVTTKDQFRNVVMSTGLSVALLYNQQSDISVKILNSIGQLSKRYPSVTFLKVNVEEIPNFAKSECINSLPSFRIYENGSDVEEIEEVDCDKLDRHLQGYRT